jgi:hypothetical protein
MTASQYTQAAETIMFRAVYMFCLLVLAHTHHKTEDENIVVAEAQVLRLVLLPPGQQAKAGIITPLKEGSWYGK